MSYYCPRMRESNVFTFFVHPLGQGREGEGRRLPQSRPGPGYAPPLVTLAVAGQGYLQPGPHPDPPSPSSRDHDRVTPCPAPPSWSGPGQGTPAPFPPHPLSQAGSWQETPCPITPAWPGLGQGTPTPARSQDNDRVPPASTIVPLLHPRLGQDISPTRAGNATDRIRHGQYTSWVSRRRTFLV